VTKLLLISLLALVSCTGSRNGPTGGGKPEWFPDPTVAIHVSELTVTVNVWVRLRESDVLFQRTDRLEEFKAGLQVHASVLTADRKPVLVDSTSVSVQPQRSSSGDGYIILPVALQEPAKGRYKLRLTITDFNRHESRSFSYVLNTLPESHQRLVFLDATTFEPVFDQAQPGQEIMVEGCSGSTTCYIGEIPADYSYPSPPFSDKPHRVKQPWNFRPYSGELMQFRDSVIYLACRDTASRQGSVFVHLTPTYPLASTGKALISPLRYLTSQQEFETLSKHPDPETAAREFWQKMAGTEDSDRAKRTQLVFTRRVEEANRRFGGTREGFLTDRGMMYLILGEPNRISRRDDREIWVYGEDRTSFMTVLTFDRVHSPPLSPDYILKRGPLLKPLWYRAVDTWRSGHPFVYF
jgi:GWxTD domain-containing protein